MGAIADMQDANGLRYADDNQHNRAGILRQEAGVEVHAGDFVIFRTGQMESCLKAGEWGGYAGGDAPGLRFETVDWIRSADLAAICAETWGCEVQPAKFST